MAPSRHVPVMLLAAVALGLAMTSTAFKFSPERPRLMGEVEDADINDEEVQYVVDFTLQEYNKNSSDLNLSRLVRVVNARQQVGLGMNYYLDLEISRTTCTKSQSNQEDCPFSDDRKQLCSFVVHFRAWEYYIHLASSSCRIA
ncbi:Cystatin-C [Heterocephalus glaber]|uniref:Cystatin-C n=1 Tax=Heterocephalus glaber TaxID=10181 RepID=G5CBE1_HETGA|nr:cystatin-C [Heterocephalus glaber]EHB18852.1 Cystatin-C [Heterocephalus glaber]